MGIVGRSVGSFIKGLSSYIHKVDIIVVVVLIAANMTCLRLLATLLVSLVVAICSINRPHKI